MQSIGQEQNRRTDDEPFPTQGDNTEGNTGEHSVRHGRLSVLGDITECTNERHGVRRGDLGDTSGASVLDSTQPIHEPDRDEQHHESVVVSQCPCRVGDVGGHEGDEPSGQNTSALAKVVLGDGGDGEDRQSTVNSWQGEHAPPNSVLRRANERFKEHGTDGHGP